MPSIVGGRAYFWTEDREVARQTIGSDRVSTSVSVWHQFLPSSPQYARLLSVSSDRAVACSCPSQRLDFDLGKNCCRLKIAIMGDMHFFSSQAEEPTVAIQIAGQRILYFHTSIVELLSIARRMGKSSRCLVEQESKLVMGVCR